MPSWNEIKNMSDEQVTAENKKLMKRLVLTKIVAPIVIGVTVHYAVDYIINRIDSKTTEN